MKTTRADSLRIAELQALVGKVELYPMSSRAFGSPTLLPFVKGLIFSSEIIEIAREHIKDGFYVDWGQIIDMQNGNLLSRENDIVIYEGKPYKPFQNKTMRFVIVDKSKTRVAIQCTSSIDNISEEHKRYCRDLANFVPEVWYFAECCWAKNEQKIKQIKKKLELVGYSKFFYLYSMDDRSLEKRLNERVLINFIKLIEKIK